MTWDKHYRNLEDDSTDNFVSDMQYEPDDHETPYLGDQNLCSDCGQDCAEDVDCEACGLKFWVRSCLYKSNERQWPRQCPRCVSGQTPPYEY